MQKGLRAAFLSTSSEVWAVLDARITTKTLFAYSLLLVAGVLVVHYLYL